MKNVRHSRRLARLTSVLLCGSMLVSNAFPAAAASDKKKKEDKIETVYVNADAEGKEEKITVSEQLKNNGSGSVDDYSTLKNIKNVKGDEEYTQGEDGSLTWTGDGEDIYYQGETDARLPVTVKVTYYLDGKKISPDKLAGKSGKVKIRFDYTNHTRDTVKVKGKNVNVQTPFTIISAMILPAEHFSNIEVENGKAVSDGDRNIVVGMAMPGLKDSLKLADHKDFRDLDIPDYVEVTADANKFELSMTATMINTGLLNDMDLDDVDKLDDLKKDMDKLTDASTKLVEGSGDLLDGMKTLDKSMETYTNGVSKVDDGARELKDSLTKLSDNKEAFESGAEGMTKGLKSLKNGTKTISQGIKDYTDGTTDLEKGIASAASGSNALKSGAGDLSKGIKDYTSGVKEIQNGLNTINSQLSEMKTPSNDEMDKVSKAASGLANDAEKLEKIIKELQSTVNKMSEVHDRIESGIPATIAACEEAAESEASGKAEEEVGKQAEKAKEQASDAIKRAEDDANSKIDEAAKEASQETKDAIRSKVEGLRDGENGDMIDRVLNEIDEVSAKGSDKHVELDSDVDVGSGDVDINVDISGDGEVKSAESDLKKIKAEKVDVSGLKSLLEDMEQQAGVLKAFGTQVHGLSSNLPAMKSGVKGLSDGADKLAKNNDDLNKGMKQLSDGIDSLNNGLYELEAGAKKLTSNNDDLIHGASELDEGAEKLLSGSKKLEIAVKKVTTAADLLATGSVKLKDGTGKLVAAGDKLNSGTGKLVSGSQELSESMNKFDKEGVSEIADLAGDELDAILTQFKAVKKADKNYQSFAGIKDGARGSVKFVIETDAIEAEED